jgi:zinc/manganese transport system permease protein
MDVIKLMLAPAAECLVLVGIHSYFGIHVIRRGVIFIDLALAQIAALGTTVGFLLGMMPDSTAAFMFSVLFTFLGAAIFATTRLRHEVIPHEAVIGIVYAVAAAMAILVIDRAPQGAEHLKEILVGRIVWVRWDEVRSAAIAYAVIGAIHIALRDKFLMISLKPDEAFKRGLNVRFWDFLFYMTFGFVISFSVDVAGVLLVFIFLVVPAVAAILITQRLLYQLLIGWAMGTVVTVGGIVMSYYLNLPGGPAIVAFYGLILILVVLPLYIYRSENRKRAAVRVLAGTAVTAAVAFAVYGIGIGLKHSPLGSSSLIEATEHHHQEAETLGTGQGDETMEAGEEETDAISLFERAESLADEGRKREALEAVIELLAAEDTPAFFREKSLGMLKTLTGKDFGFDLQKSAAENQASVGMMREHLKGMQD